MKFNWNGTLSIPNFVSLQYLTIGVWLFVIIPVLGSLESDVEIDSLLVLYGLSVYSQYHLMYVPRRNALYNFVRSLVLVTLRMEQLEKFHVSPLAELCKFFVLNTSFRFFFSFIIFFFFELKFYAQ